MRYIAAYALAVMGGNDSPTVEDLEQIIGSVGVDFDQAQAKIVVQQLAGKDLLEVIDAGKKRLAILPCAGNVAAMHNLPVAQQAENTEAVKHAAAAPDNETDSDDEGNMFDLFGTDD